MASSTVSKAETTNRQPGGGHLAPDARRGAGCARPSAVQSKVSVGEALVHRPHDPARVVDAVEEVGVAERDVAGAGVDLLGDVGEHGVLGRRCGCGRRRPPGPGSAGTGARSRASPRRSRRARSSPPRARSRVAVERREQVAGGQRERGRVAAELDLRLVGAVGGALDPAHQRRLVLAGDRRSATDGRHAGVEAVEADGLARRGARPGRARRAAVCIGTENATASAQPASAGPTARRRGRARARRGPRRRARPPARPRWSGWWPSS